MHHAKTIQPLSVIILNGKMTMAVLVIRAALINLRITISLLRPQLTAIVSFVYQGVKPQG